MTFATYDKLDVACEQLNTALRLSFETKEFWSVVALASAAEEILGAYVKLDGDKSSFEHLVEGAVQLSGYFGGKATKHRAMTRLINHAKNSGKHMDGKDNSTIRIDMKQEAFNILVRAVDNYDRLMYCRDLPETALLSQFNKYRLSADA
jgi:hypothetical protein